MKKYFFVILFLLLTSCTSFEKISEVNVENDYLHSAVRKIAVLMFSTAGQDSGKGGPALSKFAVSPDAGAKLSNIVAKHLAEWGRYVVLDRKALDEAVKLNRLNNEIVLDKKNLLSLGEFMGVDAIVTGKVEKFGMSFRNMSSRLVMSVKARVSFQVRCIDVTTNQTIWSMNIEGSSGKDDEVALASKLVAESIKILKEKIK